jgi:hypothetical protein
VIRCARAWAREAGNDPNRAGLPTFFIALGLVVAGSIVCGLLGEQLGIRTDLSLSAELVRAVEQVG